MRQDWEPFGYHIEQIPISQQSTHNDTCERGDRFSWHLWEGLEKKKRERKRERGRELINKTESSCYSIIAGTITWTDAFNQRCQSLISYCANYCVHQLHIVSTDPCWVCCRWSEISLFCDANWHQHNTGLFFYCLLLYCKFAINTLCCFAANQPPEVVRCPAEKWTRWLSSLVNLFLTSFLPASLLALLSVDSAGLPYLSVCMFCLSVGEWVIIQSPHHHHPTPQQSSVVATHTNTPDTNLIVRSLDSNHSIPQKPWLTGNPFSPI